MKILMDYYERKKYPDCPLTIPDSLLNEEQAQRNHGQTLKRLNERGGLGPCEAIAIIEKRRWHKMDQREAIDMLKELSKETPQGG
jgi:hypothetical protein